MSYPKYDPRNRDPSLQPTYEYETEEEFFQAYDAAFQTGWEIERPSLLDHPNAEDMLRAGFKPSDASWLLMVPGKPPQDIGVAHDIHGTWMWVHVIYGEGERVSKFFPRLMDALQRYHNKGPYTDYFRSPWGSGLPGDRPAYDFNDDTLIQVEPPHDLP